ncbi:hypothetical protein PBOI14_13490 [Pseudomonas sp. Boi14]|nr:hypothetical protein PBOI14_13490 [Pseudomonas sp. Boi14]
MNHLLALRPDDSQPTPLYLQLARNLEAAIHAGQWKAEQALPSERNLSELLGISRVTARKALEVLFEQGLIRRSQGSGPSSPRAWSNRCRGSPASAKCCA